MITLNNLITLLQTFATNHEQIKSGYFGETYEQLSGGQSIVYPMLFGDIKSVQVSGTTETTLIDFYICDRVRKGDAAMRLEVLSDTKLIGLDLLSYANSMSSDIVIGKEIAFEELVEAFDDEVSGWVFPVEFRQKFEYDLCSVPLTS